MSDDIEGRLPQEQAADRQQQQPRQQNAQRGRDGEAGSTSHGGGHRREGGASQDFAGQGGDKSSAADQAEHNIRGGGVGSRPTSP